jgi:hypothetical protein
MQDHPDHCTTAITAKTESKRSPDPAGHILDPVDYEEV